MTIASILSDLWRGGGAFEALPPPPGPGTPKKPRRNRVKVLAQSEGKDGGGGGGQKTKTICLNYIKMIQLKIFTVKLL